MKEEIDGEIEKAFKKEARPSSSEEQAMLTKWQEFERERLARGGHRQNVPCGRDTCISAQELLFLGPLSYNGTPPPFGGT